MRHIQLLLVLLLILACFIPQRGIAKKDDVHDIKDLSLDSLLNIQISAAAKYKQKISEAPASVTIITSEDIERYGYRTLEDVFRNIRGFYVSNDRNYTYIGVRGFSRPTDYNNRISILINGRSINENIWQSGPVGTDLALDLDMIDGIEIVRGPGSVLYGTNAMFAVVNIITKDGNQINGLKVSTEAGSYGWLKGSAMYGKELANGMNIMVAGGGFRVSGKDLFYKEFDNPSTNNGIAENLDWDNYYGFLTEISYKNFTLQGDVTSREKGIPTASWGTTFNDPRNKTLDERQLMELKYDRKIGSDKNMVLRGYYQHYYYRGWSPYELLFTDHANGSWLGGEFQFSWDLQSNNRLTVGAEYQNHYRAEYITQLGGEPQFSNNSPFRIYSLYIQDEYQVLRNLSFTFGLRRDKYSRAGSSTTPRGALIFNPAKSSTLKLLYGEAFRAPNIWEVFYDDPFIGYKENLDLKPERIRTMELVWEERISDELFGTVSLYDNEMKDLIDQTVDPSDSLWQYRNVSRAKARGLELELNAKLKMSLGGYVSYTYQRAEDPNLKQKLTNSPSHVFKLGFSYPVKKLFYASTQLLYETERITVYGTKTKPYLLTDLNLVTKPLLGHLKLSFLVKNLFDVEYSTPGGFEHVQDAIIQDGRTFITKLEYRL